MMTANRFDFAAASPAFHAWAARKLFSVEAAPTGDRSLPPDPEASPMPASRVRAARRTIASALRIPAGRLAPLWRWIVRPLSVPAARR